MEGFYFNQVIHPYESITEEKQVRNIEFYGVSNEELSFIENEVNQLYKHTEKAILLCFGGNIFEAGQMGFGYEQFFINMALNKNTLRFQRRGSDKTDEADIFLEVSCS